MKFMMIHVIDESAVPHGDASKVGSDLNTWVEEMLARGIELDGAQLCPTSDATTVQTGSGKTVVIDGPFAETKEQIAGYDVLECRDLDEALAVAAAHPTTAVGAIEVRPFGPDMPTPQVPDEVAPGTKRYMLMVAANMASYETFFPEIEDAHADGPVADDPEDDIAVWLDKYADERIYGWELAPSSRARTVRRVDGDVLITDGPFAETKEQICGFDLFECHDLDSAIAAAADHPAGTVEVRPLWNQ